MRVRKGAARTRAHKRVLKAAKGCRGGRSKLHRTAMESVDRGLRFAYRDRRARKRDFRRLWITRVRAAAEQRGLLYSRFINGLQMAGVTLNRKSLEDGFLWLETKIGDRIGAPDVVLPRDTNPYKKKCFVKLGTCN